MIYNIKTYTHTRQPSYEDSNFLIPLRKHLFYLSIYFFETKEKHAQEGNNCKFRFTMIRTVCHSKGKHLVVLIWIIA